MLALVESIGIDLNGLLAILAISAIVLVLAYYRFVFSFFDPLCVFLIVLVADCALTLAPPWDSELKWHFVGFTIFLWLGFALRGRPAASHPPLAFRKETLFELQLMLILLCCVIVFGNLYLGSAIGFPLLSGAPSAQKVAAYTGGLGIVRRINMGPYLFFCCGCMIMALLGHARRLCIALLLVGTFFVVLGGSKGVLLPAVYALAFVLAHRGLGTSALIRKRAKRYNFLILLTGVAVALIVTTKDQGGFSGGIAFLAMRVLLSGDVALMYFVRRDTINTLVDPTVLGYLHNLFADTLGMLRISAYEQSLGALILGGDDGFGPNAQYFVQADLYFGPIYGLLYCGILGYAIATMRARFFNDRTDSATWFAFKLVLAASAFDLAIDAGIFVVDVAALALFVVPLWLSARMIRVVVSCYKARITSSFPPATQAATH
jgi:hypothetical protein